jgi:hypothetical protein
MSDKFPAEGGCACRTVRYRVKRAPIIVHCCHCRWCQRETGAAFALNAVIEATEVELLSGKVELIDTPSESGKGQKIARCTKCHVAVWSHYSNGGPAFSFIRVGTLDNPDLLAPDIHIFTASKQPWVRLPEGARTSKEFYNVQEVWSAEQMGRWRAAKEAAAKPKS